MVLPIFLCCVTSSYPGAGREVEMVISDQALGIPSHKRDDLEQLLCWLWTHCPRVILLMWGYKLWHFYITWVIRTSLASSCSIVSDHSVLHFTCYTNTGWGVVSDMFCRAFEHFGNVEIRNKVSWVLSNFFPLKNNTSWNLIFIYFF